MVSELAPPESV